MRKYSKAFAAHRLGIFRGERFVKEAHEMVNSKGVQLMQNTLLQKLLLRAGVWA